MEQQPVPAAAAAEVPAGLGLTAAEYAQLLPTVEAHHRHYAVEPGRCSSLVAQRIKAPAAAVWAIVRRFDCPQVYKTFIRSCELLPDAQAGDELRPGRVREVSVVPGLPAETSTERLDLLDDARRALGFTVIGGEHGLQNYRSVTTVSELELSPAATAEICTVVLESYVVDVPDGSSEEETRLLADAIVGVNLQKLKSVVEEENGSAGGWGRRLRAVVVRFFGTLCACCVRGK